MFLLQSFGTIDMHGFGDGDRANGGGELKPRPLSHSNAQDDGGNWKVESICVQLYRAGAQVHSLTHTHTHTYTHVHAHTRTYTHVHADKHACARAPENSHSCMHIRTHTQARTHAHTHDTHKHTVPLTRTCTPSRGSNNISVGCSSISPRCH